MANRIIETDSQVTAGGLRSTTMQSEGTLASSERIEKIIVIALFVCAMACYANTLTNAFVYDDDQQILQNPYVKSWHYLPQIFTTNVWSFVGAAGSTNYYRPLMTLTYLVLWKSFGQLPFGFHLFNIFLNALVVVGVYYTGRDLFKDRGIAAVAAFLFAVHPIHTETVSLDRLRARSGSDAAAPDRLPRVYKGHLLWTQSNNCLVVIPVAAGTAGQGTRLDAGAAADYFTSTLSGTIDKQHHFGQNWVAMHRYAWLGLATCCAA